VRVKFSVPNGSTIARGRVEYSGPIGSGGVNASIKLSSGLSGVVMLKFSGRRLIVDRVEINGLSTSAAIDGLPGPLSNLANDLRGKLTGSAGNAFDKGRFLEVFKQLSDRSDKTLLHEVAKRAKSLGFLDVSKIERIAFENGFLQVHVEGKRIMTPELATLATLKSAWTASQSAKSTPAMPASKGKAMPSKGW
jgi:hypothetical protein